MIEILYKSDQIFIKFQSPKRQVNFATHVLEVGVRPPISKKEEKPREEGRSTHSAHIGSERSRTQILISLFLHQFSVISMVAKKCFFSNQICSQIWNEDRRINSPSFYSVCLPVNYGNERIVYRGHNGTNMVGYRAFYE